MVGGGSAQVPGPGSCHPTSPHSSLSQEADAALLLLSQEEKWILRSHSLNGMLMMGGRACSLFTGCLLQGPPPRSLAEPQVIPPHHCPESLQRPGPGSWVRRAPGLPAQPSCPPERALALVSLICPLLCSEVVGAPVRVK